MQRRISSAKCASIKWFYFVSIFCLANGSLVTWLFMGTPLSMWRQIIWILGLMLIGYFYPQLRLNRKYKKLQKWHFVAFYYILLSSFIASAIYGYNYLRLVYGFWIYFAGLPFIVFPYLIAKFNLITPKRFFNIFTGLGIFMSLGLLADYYTGGIITKTFLVGTSSGLEGLLEEERYCFLSEAPTTFGVYFCFCLVCTIMSIYLSKSTITKTILCLAIFMYIGSSWVTGSRQIVAVLLVTTAIAFIYYLFKIKDNKTFLVIGLVALGFMLPKAFHFIVEQDSYEARFSEQAIKGDTRSDNWKKGWRETVVDNPQVLLFGRGATYIQGQKALPDEEVGSHYENTFFSRINELGIVGLLLLVFPTYFLIKNWRKSSLFFVLMLGLNIAFLITCFVSPNGNHQTTQMVMYLATGMVLYADYFDVGKDRTTVTVRKTKLMLPR